VLCDIRLVHTFTNQPGETVLLGAVSPDTKGSHYKPRNKCITIRCYVYILQHASKQVTVLCFQSRAQRIFILNLQVVLLSADIRQPNNGNCPGY